MASNFDGTQFKQFVLQYIPGVFTGLLVGCFLLGRQVAKTSAEANAGFIHQPVVLGVFVLGCVALFVIYVACSVGKST